MKIKIPENKNIGALACLLAIAAQLFSPLVASAAELKASRAGALAPAPAGPREGGGGKNSRQGLKTEITVLFWAQLLVTPNWRRLSALLYVGIASGGHETDYLARITAYSSPTASWSYIYAPTGDRIAKQHVGLGFEDDNQWDLNSDNDVLASYHKSGSTEVFDSIYVSPGMDGRLARIDGTGTATYFMNDALNSVHQVTGAGGALAGTDFNDAWGNPIDIGLGAPGGLDGRFSYTNRERDNESGLMFYRARSYDPQSGRFAARDRAPASNLYAYVENNPVTFVDPLGLWKWKGGKRQGGERAKMLPEEGDTTETAATFTKLDALETEKWLQDSAGHWVKPGEKINTSLEYESPNTVVIGVGAGGVAATFLATWQARLTDALEKRGFNVASYRYDLDATEWKVEQAARGKDVWGLALFGHGYKKIKAWYNWSPDPEAAAINGGLAWDGDNTVITATSVAPHHKFGLMISYFCYAELQPWSGLVSPKGKYYGSNGVLSAASGPRGIGFWGSWDGLVGSAAD